MVTKKFATSAWPQFMHTYSCIVCPVVWHVLCTQILITIAKYIGIVFAVTIAHYIMWCLLFISINTIISNLFFYKQLKFTHDVS